MAYLVKRVLVPQDIYILGEGFDVKSTGFGITDDYHTIDVTNGEELRMLDTIGWVDIFTKEELIAALPYISDGYEPGDNYNQEGLILKDFVGDITLELIAQDDSEEHGIKVGDDLLDPAYDCDRTKFHEVDAWYAFDRKYYNGKDGCVVDTELLLILPEGTVMGSVMGTEKIVEPFNKENETN